MRSFSPSPEGLVRPDKLGEDVDLLLQVIHEAHPAPFAYQHEETFSSILQEFNRIISHPLTAREIYRGLAPVVSSLRNGHTWVLRLDEFERRAQSGGRIFPLSLDWNGEDVWLTAHRGVSSPPIGSVIRKINGEDASDVVRRIGRYVPMEGSDGNPWLVRREDWLRYWLWIEYGNRDAMELTLSDSVGAGSHYVVKAVPLSDLPLDQRQERPDFAFRHIPERPTAVVEFNLFSDPANCCSFVDDTFAEIHRTGISHIILDLRQCRGGISTGVERLLQYLLDDPFLLHSKIQTKVSPLALERQIIQDPKAKIGTMSTHRPQPIRPVDKAMRFTGNVVVLIGPLMYSNAVSCAHALRHYRKAVLIGERTGDSTASYGGQESFHLPNSGLSVGIATQFVVCPGAEHGGGGLVPDYEAKPTPEDTVGGNDQAIQVALQLLAGANPTL